MALISIIKKSDIVEARRFDAEYFKPEYLQDDKNLENKGFFILSNIANVKGGKRLPLGEKFSKDGVPYIRAEDIKNSFVEYENAPRISLKLHEKLEKYQTKKGDVLLTIVGSVGDVGLVNFELEKCNLTENAAKITDLKELNPATMFSYMLSRYGQNQIHREKVGTVQSKLSLDRIRKFKVPILSQSFQFQVEKIVKSAYQKQTQSKQLYKEAERLLLEELELVDYKPKHRLTFTATKKEIGKARRFDAEYFQPKYKEIIEKIENYDGGFDFVKNTLIFNDKNFYPKNNEFYYYIPLSNVSADGNIEIPQKELGKNLPTRARRLVREGDVIVSSISGSLETSALIEKEHDGFIVSNGFFVFKSLVINSETLLTLFKSPVMLLQLERISKGTILGGYDLSSFKQLKIPIIKQQIQEQIAEKIQESHKLRKESKGLLEEAKRKIEKEIERSACD